MGGRVHEKAVNFIPSLKRLLGILKPERLLVALVIIMGSIGVAFNVVNPKILARGTDAIFEGLVGKMLGAKMLELGIDPATVSAAQIVEMLRNSGENQLADMISGMPNLVVGQGIDFERLGSVLLAVIGLVVVASVLLFFQSFLLNRVVQRSVYRMRQDVSAKIDRLPLSYFDRQPRGELLSRVTNDIDNIQQSLQQSLSQLVNSLLSIIGVTIMMFTVSWQLALVTLCIVPVAGVSSALIGKRAQTRFVSMWAATGALNSQVEEAYTGHALVKTFGRRREVDAAFAETNEKLRKSAFGAQFMSAVLMPLNFFIGNLNYVVIAVLGGVRVATGTMSLGDVQAFIQYSRQFTQPIAQVASMANLLQSGVASAERVFEMLDATEQVPETAGTLPEPITGHVEFCDVDFSYYADEPLIAGLNIEALPGQSIAIVGPTGAGKTTLVNLLMRFYELQGGRILLDGVDIASVPRHSLRNQFGMVLQDTWLFSGSIYDNIAYGKVGATREEVLNAAKAAYVDRFVHNLPAGYDTLIDEEGSNVSAGEKQLITIARAFISDPAVLILDEATSSVDTRTEVLVQQAMARLRTGRTSFVIAHRLSTIQGADVILVMQHGTIVEHGSHAELMAAGGEYYKLYQSQFAGALED
ncbi:MAG: ABC transporter ATP-binding protein/permease [Propionibacteriaceae bacterium]|nr:ABC transporter ATP-binding protein/permease [Propionibacteriaceae bacterium]